MITRKEYMDKEYTHEEYYGQFVNDAIIKIVGDSIGVDRIKASTDKHLNDIPLKDIPLKEWDNLVPAMHSYARKKLVLALDGSSTATGVCIAKAAARAIQGEGRHD